MVQNSGGRADVASLCSGRAWIPISLPIIDSTHMDLSGAARDLDAKRAIEIARFCEDV